MLSINTFFFFNTFSNTSHILFFFSQHLQMNTVLYRPNIAGFLFLIKINTYESIVYLDCCRNKAPHVQCLLPRIVPAPRLLRPVRPVCPLRPNVQQRQPSTRPSNSCVVPVIFLMADSNLLFFGDYGWWFRQFLSDTIVSSDIPRVFVQCRVIAVTNHTYKNKECDVAQAFFRDIRGGYPTSIRILSVMSL